MNSLNNKPKFLTSFIKKYSIASTIFILMGNIFTYYKIVNFTLIYSMIVMILIIFFILMCIVR